MTFQSNSPFSSGLLYSTASAIASCVSALLHISSKSSDQEKEMFLARVEWLTVTFRSHGQLATLVLSPYVTLKLVYTV